MLIGVKVGGNSEATSISILSTDQITKTYKEIEIVIAGADISDHDIPFEITHLGNLTLKQTAELLWNRFDIRRTNMYNN